MRGAGTRQTREQPPRDAKKNQQERKHFLCQILEKYAPPTEEGTPTGGRGESPALPPAPALTLALALALKD